jgi:CubicO group peptidase (beta-lactamase class C family)
MMSVVMSIVRHVFAATVLVLVGCLVAPEGAMGASASGEARAGTQADAPAVRTLRTLLDLIAANDEARSRAEAPDLFAGRLVDHYGEDGVVDFVRQMADELGAFEISEIRLDEPTRAVALLVAEDGVRKRLRCGVTEQPPHAIIGFSLEDAESPYAVGELPAFGSLDEAMAALDALGEVGKFSGVVLVHRPGHADIERAYGLAEREAARPNTIDTRFNVGSITKTFTKVATLQLEEAGELSLDDPIDRHLPDIPRRLSEGVTVRQLLEHTSGLADYTRTGDFRARAAELRTIADHLPLLEEVTFDFEPGSGSEYSNTNYLLLGAIVEALTDMSYQEYVTRHVFAPAGLRASSFVDLERLPDDAAMGYTRLLETEDGAPGAIGGVARPVGQSDGGSFSTARDLWRFSKALTGGELLSPLGTRRVIFGLDAAADEPIEGMDCNAGGAPGISAMLCVDLGSGTAIVVLANQDEPAAETVGSALLDVIEGGGSGGS